MTVSLSRIPICLPDRAWKALFSGAQVNILLGNADTNARFRLLENVNTFDPAKTGLLEPMESRQGHRAIAREYRG